MAAKKAKPKARKSAARARKAPRRPPAKPRTFKTLAQVRAAVDAVDRKIVPLMVQRLFYVTQAARFKPSANGVVVLSRVEEAVQNARRLATAAGGNPDTIEAVYRSMIDAFTLDEQAQWRKLHRRP